MRYLVGHCDDGRQGFYARLGLDTTDFESMRSAFIAVQHELESYGFSPRLIAWSVREQPSGPPPGPEREAWKRAQFAEHYGASDYKLWDMQLGSGAGVITESMLRRASGLFPELGD